MRHLSDPGRTHPGPGGPSDLEWLERVARPSWQHAAVVVAAFGGAFGCGALLAWLTHPGSAMARGMAGFAFLLIFLVGYQLWVAHIVAVLVRGLFAGLRRALVRALFTRRPGEVAREATTLLERLRDPAVQRDLIGRVRARTRVFRTIGAVVGVPLGLGFGVAGPELGFPTTFLLYAAAAIAYGIALARLAWLGYLPLPEDLET